MPRVVVAATLAFGALAAMWSVVAPLGEAPDEPAHLALVMYLADGHPYPSFDQLQNPAAMIRFCKTFASATRACPREGEPVTPTSMRRHPVGEAPAKGARPAWRDEGGRDPIGQINQMPQHPPLYYQAMATVLRVERALLGHPLSTDRELALLRLVNVALIMPLPLLAWWAARRYGYDETVALLAAVGVFAVPMLTHIGSTLNNDNLLTLLGGLIVALLAGVVRGDRSARTAVLVGVVAGLALLTKAFGAVFPPAIAVAYLLGSREPGDPPWSDRLRSVVRPLATAGGLTLLLSAWWFIGVRARTGQFAPTVETAKLTSALRPPDFEPNPVEFAKFFFPTLNNRFWGSFGWYTIRFPGWLATVCTLVVVGAVIAALVPKRSPELGGRLQRWSLLMPMKLLGVMVVVRAWDLHVRTSKFQFIQGRYLFAGIVGLVVLVAAGARGLATGWSDARWTPLVAAGAAAAIQVEALRRCMQGWWGGPGLGPRGQLRAMIAWSGWPGEFVAALLVAAVVALTWFGVELLRAALTPPVGSDAA